MKFAVQPFKTYKQCSHIHKIRNLTNEDINKCNSSAYWSMSVNILLTVPHNADKFFGQLNASTVSNYETGALDAPILRICDKHHFSLRMI